MEGSGIRPGAGESTPLKSSGAGVPPAGVVAAVGALRLPLGGINDRGWEQAACATRMPPFEVPTFSNGINSTILQI